MIRNYNSYFKILFVLALVLFGYVNSEGQTTIEGPTCVMGSTVYQYNINGARDSAAPFQLCISGGQIDTLNSNCLTGTGIPLEIKIKWADSSHMGNISLESAGYNTSLQVNLTTPLIAGSIDSISKMQVIHQNQVPVPVHCSAPSGGSCAPQYMYQWQQSADNRQWEEIEDASQEQLTFEEPLIQTNYYRRKITEAGSNTISYSDAALIIVLK